MDDCLPAALDPRAANPPMVPVPIAELDLGELDFEQLGAPRRKEQDILTRLEDLRQNVSREARALLMNLDEEMGRGIIVSVFGLLPFFSLHGKAAVRGRESNGIEIPLFCHLSYWMGPCCVVCVPAQLDDEHSIGRGGFGKVFRGMFHGTPVAIKVIDFHDKGVENRIPLDVFVDELVVCQWICALGGRGLQVFGVSMVCPCIAHTGLLFEFHRRQWRGPGTKISLDCPILWVASL